jgi:cephalosporin-C deacetylase-like acetyl esterase
MRWLPFIVLCTILQAQDSLNFLVNHTDGPEIRRQFPEYRKRLANEALAVRRRAVEQIRTPQDLAARRAYIRERILAEIGGLPERTPLNPQVVGVIDRDDYRVEKVVFESQPRFFVTASLYLPKRGTGPWPGVLFPLGHEEGSKSHHAWQHVLVSLAKKGYVALAWDPVGQGERVQMYDEDFGESKVVQSTTEHTILGLQCLLAGDALARYTIYDGIRALDYLLSRPEVDKGKIAVTGNSGGGTHTSYLAALEDRIHVAAPSCYITSWGRLLDTIGPQDAEQCFPGFLADGLDHGDFLLAFAPRPFLVLSAIRDFFSIQGARRTFAEARDVYARMNSEANVSMFEADDGHGYTKPRRLAAYQWFARWLQDGSDADGEPEIRLATEEELWCTKTGQVATSLGGETVHSLNQKRVDQAKAARPRVTTELVQKLIGFEKPAASVNIRDFGEIRREGYRIQKLVYESEPGIPVPAALFVPEAPAGRKPAIIYVHGRGKAAARADLEALVQAGNLVLAIDARGLGEMRAINDENGSDWSRYFGDYDATMTAVLLRKTLVGMRAVDIARGVDLLAARADVDPTRISGIGVEAGAVPLLHAAVLDPRISKVAVQGMLLSYESVVRRRIHRGVFEQVIPGVLKAYDLPDLAAAISPRPVFIADAVDPVGNLVLPAETGSLYKTATILRRRPEDTAATLFRAMLGGAAQ